MRAIARVHTVDPGSTSPPGRTSDTSAPAALDVGSGGGAREVISPRESGPEALSVVGRGVAQRLASVTLGIMYDTRDSEFVTRRGIYYQAGVGPTLGTAEGIAFGEASVVLAHFAPLPGPFVFASRFVASFQFGRIPFYDLAQGGNFEPQYLVGSENGVRGVPEGRYIGP